MPPPLSARTLQLEPLSPAERQGGQSSVRAISVKRRAPIERAETTTAPAEAEVLVPREEEEIDMYRRLIAAAQAVKGPALVEIWTRMPAELSISAILIDPIRIDLIAPPVGGEGDRPW